MPSIQLLDQDTINQIAAGEVIERPSSVVKELTENSLDAGASAVTVEIRDGGTTFLRVTDNGCGIDPEDVERAFMPHATSKIRSAQDLLNISSLGFRGEALASIATVSRVEMISKTQENLAGIRCVTEGGEEPSCEEVGAPDGTTFIVRDLFFNTPARRKFLKTPATEASYISSLVEHLALSRPDISFRLIVNNQTKLHTSGNHKLKDVIYTIYGKEIASSLIPVQAEEGGFSLRGFIGKPEINRGNRTYENYFVNGRYVKSNIITRSLENAYRGFVMQHKYPFAVFHLSIDPEAVDVNVHPTKMELRFREEEAVSEFIFKAIRDALKERELIPGHVFDDIPSVRRAETGEKVWGGRGPEPFEFRRKQASGFGAQGKEQPHLFRERPASGRERSTIEEILAVSEQAAGRPDPGKTVQKKEAEENRAEIAEPARETRAENVRVETAPRQMELFEDRLLTEETRSAYKVIGQLFGTYWLIQYRDTLLIMDQHAAHEKVLFEKNMEAFRRKEFTSQDMMPPWILTLNTRQSEVLRRFDDRFRSLGYRIESFGGREYAVYAVPANLPGLDQADYFTEILDTLAEESPDAETAAVEEKMALVSCKAAVKGNMSLSLEEVNSLLDDMLKLENPYMCPHGRPTIITMSKYELEKKFKRVVS